MTKNLELARVLLSSYKLSLKETIKDTQTQAEAVVSLKRVIIINSKLGDTQFSACDFKVNKETVGCIRRQWSVYICSNESLTP